MVIVLPKELQIEGVRFVLLKPRDKIPIQPNWQNKNLSYNDGELLAWISENGNYGVMGGGNKNLVILDFDNERVQEMICSIIPKTFTIKTGSGKLHKYFFSDKSESFKVFTEDMNTLVDVQGEGKQVVAPGSIHPNGNKYQIIDSSPIAFLPYAEIKAILNPYDKKPKKDEIKKEDKPRINVQDDFLDDLKKRLSMQEVLSSFGIDTSRNPTQCYFHSSNGGKCLGFNNETAHCFHCDGSWNIFSFVKEAKHYDFKEALEYLANLAGMQDELELSRRKYIDALKEAQRDDKREIKETFLSLIKDKKLNDATELLVNYIKKNNYIFSSKDDEKSEMWIYKNGIYVPQGKCAVKEIVRDILGNWFNVYYANQVIAKLEADDYVEIDKFFAESNIYEIPVKNGILNILTRQLKDFSPEKVFFNKLPIEYNPQSTCPQIDKFLEQVLAKEEDKNVFYEFGGFCLLKEYKFEKALMLVGDGRNGKDKSLELIKRVLGIENCCAVPLSSIVPDSFIISEFFNRMANVAGDINNNDLKDTSSFKGLTGRSIQTAPRKFQKPVTFINYAKFIFACNNLPMVYDTSKGFWDRWVLLEYPYTFVQQDELNKTVDKTNLKLRDESIIERITTPEELSGLLNKFLEGLDRLMQFRTFSSTKGSQEIKDLWIRRSNSAMAFCMDMVEESYDCFISKKDFRKKYTTYCKKHKISAKSDFVIKKTIEEQFGGIEGNKDVQPGKWEKVWEGIKWRFNL